MPAYRLPSPYDRAPLRRRATSFALALAINLALLLLLIGLGVVAPPTKPRSSALTVDLLPESRSASAEQTQKNAVQSAPAPKPPPIVIPTKPTIAPPRTSSAKPWIEMSKDELDSADISKLPAAGAEGAGDSEVVGHGPHGETFYRADWARRPTNAEVVGYLPKNAPDGAGVIACKTIPDNRVDDCMEIESDPPGSHLASAVRQAAWQFRVRPPRKNGVPLVGAWVRIAICYNIPGCDD